MLSWWLTSFLPAESLYIILIESDEASTLLESFGTQTFNFLELFSIYKWSILLSPFNNISSSGGIQSCNMSESKVYKIHFHHWIVINTSLIHFKYMHYCRKFGLKNLQKLNTTKNVVKRLLEQRNSHKKVLFSELCGRNPMQSTKLCTAIGFCTCLTSKPGTHNLWSVGYFCNTNLICHVLWPAPSCPLQETTWEEGSGQMNYSCESSPLSAIIFQWYCNTLPQHEALASATQKESNWEQLAFLTRFHRPTQLVPFLSAALEI